MMSGLWGRMERSWDGVRQAIVGDGVIVVDGRCMGVYV